MNYGPGAAAPDNAPVFLMLRIQINFLIESATPRLNIALPVKNFFLSFI